MNKNIILSGVGGQGILSIATVIGEAASQAGLHLKQAEVHGMSQRGGDVQSNLRLSTSVIHSDIIPLGQADLVISMEPMEALRYLPWLAPAGWVISSNKPFINIPNYPDTQQLQDELNSLPHLVQKDIEGLAKSHDFPKSANMILLGMAAPYIEILTPYQLKAAITRVFGSKGEKVVNDNLEAFSLGMDENI